jgi:phosphoserine phosphatase
MPISAAQEHVTTLITNPKLKTLTQEIADKALAMLNAKQLYWLADGVACDIPLNADINHNETLENLRQMLAPHKVDVVIQSQENRRKKVLIADMDSTMIEQECIDELGDELGLKEKISHITARAMNGEIPFDDALNERVGLLEGLDVNRIDEIIEKRITLMAGGTTLVRTMKANGGYCALVSGGFTLFTAPISKTIGFDEHRSNTLEVENSKLTGKVVPPICGSQAKVDALEDIARTKALTAGDFIAVGDGANDLPMLKIAGAGVALHAKPTVAANAPHRLDFSDLTALLYLQGYRAHEFAEE